jgi:hypothetical protein
MRPDNQAGDYVLSVSCNSSSCCCWHRAGASPSGVATHMGTLHDGATFLIEVPANWNRTLSLYSHGYVVPGSSNPAEDVGDPFTRFFMLSTMRA